MQLSHTRPVVSASFDLSWVTKAVVLDPDRADLG